MTVPSQFESASRDFYKFLVDARDEAGLQTTHQAYTMVEGVLRTFRCRLSVKEALLFGNALPLLLRALFVTDWNVESPKQTFDDRRTMTLEVQALRANHNFAPDTAILDVAVALRRHMDEVALDSVLEQLGADAVEFWRVKSSPP